MTFEPLCPHGARRWRQRPHSASNRRAAPTSTGYVARNPVHSRDEVGVRLCVCAGAYLRLFSPLTVASGQTQNSRQRPRSASAASRGQKISTNDKVFYLRLVASASGVVGTCFKALFTPPPPPPAPVFVLFHELPRGTTGTPSCIECTAAAIRTAANLQRQGDTTPQKGQSMHRRRRLV